MVSRVYRDTWLYRFLLFCIFFRSGVRLKEANSSFLKRILFCRIVSWEKVMKLDAFINKPSFYVLQSFAVDYIGRSLD